MNEGLKSLLLITVFILFLSFVIPVLVRLLPFIVLILVGLYFIQKRKETKVKWHEGTKSDSYYEKVENKDVIDVEVKVREEKHE